MSDRGLICPLSEGTWIGTSGIQTETKWPVRLPRDHQSHETNSLFCSVCRPSCRAPRHHRRQKDDDHDRHSLPTCKKPKVCHLPPACYQTSDNAARTYTARSSGQILVSSLSPRIADYVDLTFVERGKYTFKAPWLILADFWPQEHPPKSWNRLSSPCFYDMSHAYQY